ncbi:unnamed protein product [Penicillium salamii]|uniref:NAD-dependent epimerase/dehydratase domain-containing protein n=1 Tax=Penicillium salamii TaxID=1612424 RepID=A0A9W4NC27_9EURO|nr:unnamed protein product [Penicillium salamii]CAG8328955.1 unnamed protein product [Penicillium salamii]CAG8354382.1 unnamed protein product [Penicillium salamii]
MGHNILITGGSGYLGGTLLAEWKNANISGYDKLFAMIRSDEQAEAVKTLYSAEPVKCSLQPDDIKHLLLENQINIVFYLIDAYKAESQVPFIQALSEVKNQTGQEVHFIYTTGTKHFSYMAGLDANTPLPDTEPSIYDIQKDQTRKSQQNPQGSNEALEACLNTNTRAIEAGEKYGVKVYIFSPCIVCKSSKYSLLLDIPTDQ